MDFLLLVIPSTPRYTVILGALVAILAFPCDGARAVKVNAQSTNGLTVIPNKAGITYGVNSMGRACGQIGLTLYQDPDTACSNMNGPIAPNRSISASDAAGNAVDADATKFGVGLKVYRARASSTRVTKFTYAFAEFADPLTVSGPPGEAFDVDLTRSFMPNDSEPGLLLSGSGPAGSAVAELTDSMSTSLTGFLFSLDLSFTLGKPLSIDLTIGSYLSDVPGWNKASLEATLSSLLGAGTPSNNFSLTDFNFPVIPISVPANQVLSIYTLDTALVSTPEPATLPLLAGPGLAVLMLCRSRHRRI